jgi:uncharacterized protein (DUF433 family)
MVLEWVANGADRQQILDAYPEDIEQALLHTT